MTKKRIRRTYKELFMSTLTEMLGREQTLIGNMTLRESWLG